MRSVVIIFSFLCATCFAQSVPGVLQFDFGNIASSAQVSHDFEFKDNVRNVVAMCECVKATVYKKVRHKETVYIVHVEFDPKEYSGDVKEEVVVVDDLDNVTHIKLNAHVIATR